MTIGIVGIALLSSYALVVVFLSAAAFLGYRMFKPLARIDAKSGRKVSIIVAAKNEADTLRECLASLVALDYPAKELIVVCGPSDDDTERVALEFAASATIMREPERPVDWLGKSWACHHGYLRSTGEMLLFTDGDVIHSKESLGVTLGNLELMRADMLSVWPQVVTRTVSERVLLPATVFFLAVGVAAVSARRTPRGRRVSGANGQYILISRDAYAKIGGHAAIKNDIMEDSAMARKALGEGLEVLNANGEGYLKVKPYLRFGELWEAHERFGAGLVPFWGALAGALLTSLIYFVGPFALLGLAIANTSLGLALVSGCLCALVYAIMAFFSMKASRLRYSILAPISGLLVLAALLSGFVRFRRGGITWKNVKYGRDRFKPLRAR